jgi:hypothetical protein
MNTYSYTGEDFKAVICNDKWKIGILRFSERFSKTGIWERHLKTSEAFILLIGSAVLYVKSDDGEITETPMLSNVVYEVAVGEWHHIVVMHPIPMLKSRLSCFHLRV